MIRDHITPAERLAPHRRFRWRFILAAAAIALLASLYPQPSPLVDFRVTATQSK